MPYVENGLVHNGQINEEDQLVTYILKVFP